MEVSGPKRVLIAIQHNWLLLFLAKHPLNVIPIRKRSQRWRTGLRVTLATRVRDMETTSLVIVEIWVDGEIGVEDELAHDMKLSVKENVQSEFKVIIEVVSVLETL